MPNEITTTYTFKGDDLPKFIEDWNRFKEEYELNGENIAKYFEAELPEDYNPRCYVEDDYHFEDSYQIVMWDAWHPHFEIWNHITDKYDLTIDIYAIDNDNYNRGLINTGEGSRYRVLYQYEEGDNPDYEFYDTFEDAQRGAEINYRYIIQEIYDDEYDWNEDLDIVEECGETGEIRDYFDLE